MPSIGPDDAALHPGQVGHASPLLFVGLVDDAAMFPPGNAPLERAVAEHAQHREAWYAELVGPLLVPATGVADLLDLVGTRADSGPLPIGVVARDRGAAVAAIDVTRAVPSLQLVAVELPLSALGDGSHGREGDDSAANARDLAAAWAELGGSERPVWWEVSRGAGMLAELDLLAAQDTGRLAGGAKLRTGGVEPSAVPNEAELATFLRHAIDVDLTFKLTAGLHHAVRTTDPVTGLEQHGVLNVLCAIKAALNGAEVDELAELLGERDPAPLVERTNGMSEADASVARAFWASFGCCGVTDPIVELAGLGLLRSATTASASAPSEAGR
jgi:hypothetical protein